MQKPRASLSRRGASMGTNSDQDVLNIRSLLAFLALRYFEADFLTFLEGFETLHVDCREMCEQILAAIIGG